MFEETSALEVAVSLTEGLLAHTWALRDTLAIADRTTVSQIVTDFLRMNVLQNAEKDIGQFCAKLSKKSVVDKKNMNLLTDLTRLYMDPDTSILENALNSKELNKTTNMTDSPIQIIKRPGSANSMITPSVNLLASLQPKLNLASSLMSFEMHSKGWDQNNSKREVSSQDSTAQVKFDDMSSIKHRMVHLKSNGNSASSKGKRTTQEDGDIEERGIPNYEKIDHKLTRGGLAKQSKVAVDWTHSKYLNKPSGSFANKIEELKIGSPTTVTNPSENLWLRYPTTSSKTETKQRSFDGGSTTYPQGFCADQIVSQVRVALNMLKRPETLIQEKSLAQTGMSGQKNSHDMIEGQTHNSINHNHYYQYKSNPFKRPFLGEETQNKLLDISGKTDGKLSPSETIGWPDGRKSSQKKKSTSPFKHVGASSLDRASSSGGSLFHPERLAGGVLAIIDRKLKEKGFTDRRVNGR